MPDPSLSRRVLVATAGASAGAAALVGGAAAVPAHARRTLRVGVLVASGTSDPRSASDLLTGLSLGFKAGRTPATLASRAVPQGYLGAVEAAEELIHAGAQVVVAGVSALAARRLAAACEPHGVPLVVANVGAHVVHEPLPGTVHSSLQHWQASLRAGEWAARALGPRLFTVVAAPDAGYDHVFALRRGFQSAGGRPVGMALTHLEPATDGVAAAVRSARLSGADVVAVCATGPRAARIVAACRAAGLRAALLVDSLAVEPGAAAAARAPGAYSAAAWTPGSAAGRDLVRAFRARTGRTPGAFAALGHDTALLVSDGARRLGAGRAGRDDLADLADVLAGARVPGARGTQVVDRRLRTVSTPLGLRRARVARGRVRHAVVARPAAVRGVPAALAGLDPDAVAAYVNEYLGT